MPRHFASQQDEAKLCLPNFPPTAKFNNNATLVKDFAQENISYHDLIVALGIVEPPEAEEYDEPDYEDYI